MSSPTSIHQLLVIKAILRVSTKRYTTELTALTCPDASFHFTTKKTTETHLDDAQLTEMATKMSTLAFQSVGWSMPEMDQ